MESIIIIVIPFKAGRHTIFLCSSIFHKMYNSRAVAISNIFPNGSHLDLCLLQILSMHCLHFLWFLAVTDLPSLLLPLLPSAGNALKPNSHLAWSFYLVLFCWEHCSQNCELHSETAGPGNSSGNLVACDYTDVAREF